MSIHNELSSDIAVALLTGKSRDAKELNQLKKMILTVHDTLQELNLKARARRRDKTKRNGEKAVTAEATGE